MILYIITWIVIVLTLYQLGVAAANLLWQEKLPSAGNDADSSGISVLIPARDEAANIPVLLNDLLNLSAPPAEIIVCDDHSTDATAQLIDLISKQHPLIKWFRSAPLPSGWTGKNFACHQLAEKASGHYFLFLDADVRIGPHAIERSVSFVRKNQLGLLSVFPKQTMCTFGEKITVPIMNFILLTLLPLILVRKLTWFSSVSAANGQFMLFHADTYRHLQPHKRVYNQRAEDIEIARLLKKNKIRIACATGDKEISCRMYRGFSEAISGFTKNIRAFFFHSYFFMLLFWFVTTFGFIFILITRSIAELIFYIAALLLIRILTSVVSRQSVVGNIICSGIQQLCFGWIILKSIISQSKKQMLWKGRYI